MGAYEKPSDADGMASYKRHLLNSLNSADSGTDLVAFNDRDGKPMVAQIKAWSASAADQWRDIRRTGEQRVRWPRAGEQPYTMVLVGDTRQLDPFAVVPGLDPAEALERLGRMLKDARIGAGKPKLATLARQIDYSDSMLSRVFNGKLLPNREKLEKLADILGVGSKVFTSRWLPLWEAASRKRPASAAPRTTSPAPQEQPAAEPSSGAPEGFSCPACGSWVTDARRHLEWHVTGDGDAFRPAKGTHLRSA
jgi:transcriptional regulator with XRE-family HTH domain